ncbi:MAG: photosynthetic reaction center cytochrome c subunit [Deltaproteobacteria bacterium]|nr:photosynthetic reaction center cytochrome c subunit [Deltaproteobacteria bacterium]
MNLLARGAGGLGALLLAAATVATFKSTQAAQLGAPGVGMQVVETKQRLAEKVQSNVAPAPLPPAAPGGVLAVNAYKNVQVLGHLSSGDFTRLMTAMTLWVAPNEGCGYCHAHQKDANGKDVLEDGVPQADLNRMDSDELYTKRVGRRMLQMTLRLNGDWKQHVKETGVTCYTCHRGNPVPANIWFDVPEQEQHGLLGNRAGQNAPSDVAGLSSLPESSLRPYLAGEEEIRVQSTVAIGSDNRASIKQTEWSYSLMIHMSKSLGVNCTFCHNSRSMGSWETSPATRSQAWFGIRMVRELNRDFLEPLTSTFPKQRLGPTGDGPKANCATCHQGAYKPLLGASMLKDYPVLAEAKPQPPKTSAIEATPAKTEPTAAANENADAGSDAGLAAPTGVDASVPPKKP